MLNQKDGTPHPKHEKIINRSRATKIAAGVVALALTGGAVHEVDTDGLSAQQSKISATLSKAASAAAKMAGVKTSTVTGEGLVNPVESDGRHSRVNQEEIDTLLSSTVSVLVKSRTPGAQWMTQCTGIKINVDGTDYVQTATHCFNPYQGYPPPGHQADNILPVINYDYAIGSPSSPNEDPLAEVVAVSTSVDGNDTALLGLAGETADFQAIPAIPITEFDSSAPPEGVEAAMVGLPESSRGIVEGTGLYLGRVPDPLNTKQQVDLVGINAPNSTVDSCYYGASGSSAFFASGYISGPLTIRVAQNEKYISGQKVDDASLSEIYRLQLEQSTGYNLQGFNVLCAYAVPDDSYQTLVQGLNTPIVYK